MSGFLLSSANRTFAAIEEKYGEASSLSLAQQVVASTLQIHQATTPSARRDKSGSRTAGLFPGGRRTTAFEMRSFLTSHQAAGLPFCDPLFQAAMGVAATKVESVTVATVFGPTSFTTVQPHGLGIGSAISFQGEIRFLVTVSSPLTMSINGPFSNPVVQNSVLESAVSYGLATTLPSLTLFDYWGVQGSFSRVLTGAVIDTLEIDATGDRHEFRFTGKAADCLDSASFVAGSAGLDVFPQLPNQALIDYSIVPGHLGQVWVGNPTALSYTLTQAQIRVHNNYLLRDFEVGSGIANVCVPGRRSVQTDISILVQDDSTTAELYQIARNRGTTPMLLQLGEQSGQMMAVYLPSVRPEVPSYDDSSQWLTWHFTGNQAMGEADDELYLAFA